MEPRAAEPESLEGRRGKRRKMPRAQREQEMLEAATRLFTERGFARVSMDEIGDACGITKPLLYTYFESKEGLYAACIERAAAPLVDAIQAAAESSPEPDVRLWRGLLAFFEFVETRRDQWQVFFAEATAHGGRAAEQVDAIRDRLAETVAALLTESAKAGDVPPEFIPETEAQAHSLIGAAEALVRRWPAHPEATAQLLALRLVNLTWLGFNDLLRGELWLPPTDPA